MSDDELIKRLRKMPVRVQLSGSWERDCYEAADAIDRLTKERDEAREMLAVVRVVLDGATERLEQVEDERDAAIKERDELLVNARKNMEEKVKLRQELRKEQEAVLFVVGQRDAAIARAEEKDAAWREQAYEDALKIDALRALLRELKTSLEELATYPDHVIRDRVQRDIARIAAATGEKE